MVQGNILGELSICLTVGPQWVKNDKHNLCMYIYFTIYLSACYIFILSINVRVRLKAESRFGVGALKYNITNYK